MIAEGQIVIFRFPQTDRAAGKLPGPYNDWLVCMVSSQLGRAVPDFDEIITPGEPDFGPSGLKVPSVIRLGRLAVVEAGILVGALGQITGERLSRIRQKLSSWIQGA